MYIFFLFTRATFKISLSFLLIICIIEVQVFKGWDVYDRLAQPSNPACAKFHTFFLYCHALLLSRTHGEREKCSTFTQNRFWFYELDFLSLSSLISEKVGHSMSCVKGRCEMGREGGIEYQMHTFGRIDIGVAGKFNIAILPCRGFWYRQLSPWTDHLSKTSWLVWVKMAFKSDKLHCSKFMEFTPNEDCQKRELGVTFSQSRHLFNSTGVLLPVASRK